MAISRIIDRDRTDREATALVVEITRTPLVIVPRLGIIETPEDLMEELFVTAVMSQATTRLIVLRRPLDRMTIQADRPIRTPTDPIGIPPTGLGLLL